MLAVLLLTQWAAAYGHCRTAGWGAGDSICTVADHGDPAAGHLPGQHKAVADRDCPACHHAPVLQVSAPPPASATPRWVATAMPSGGAATIRRAAQDPPYRAHAPPTA